MCLIFFCFLYSYLVLCESRSYGMISPPGFLFYAKESGKNYFGSKEAQNYLKISNDEIPGDSETKSKFWQGFVELVC